MTLKELSVEYRANAAALNQRIRELRRTLEGTENERERCLLADRIRILSAMEREARALAAYCGHYYERGYHHNVKYTI